MRPAVWVAVAFAVGVAVAEWLRPHPVVALAALLACGLWAALGRRQITLALLLAVAAFGTLRYAYVQTAGRGDLSVWLGQKVTLVGTVTGEPELRKPSGVGYAVDVERVEGHPASGRLYITQMGGTAPGFGERVEVQGSLKLPEGAPTPGGFDRAEYLARQGIHLVMDTGGAQRLGPGAVNPLQRAAVAVRIRLEGVLKAALPPRDAGLMAGLLFGSRTDLPDDIKEAFRASGVFHLLAVSGGNIAMITLPLIILLRRAGLKRRAAALAAIGVVVFFVLLTGAGPSVLRAGLMAVLVLLGEALQREKDAINTLGAAIFLLLIWSPGLLFDIGFQLSAGATLGILLFTRPIQQWLAPRLQRRLGEKAGGWLAAGLSVTLAAQCLVEPLSLYHFGATSLIAPVANLLVLAFLEPVVQVGLGTVLAGLALAWLAWLLGWVLRAGLWLLVLLVKAMAAIPGAYLEVGRLPLTGVILWFAAVALVAFPSLRVALRERLAACWQWWSLNGLTARLGAVAGVAALVITALTWRLALADPPDTLTVTFLDVGQGDSILIQAPGGGSMLVDTGVAMAPDPQRKRQGFDAGAEVVVPYLAREGIRRLDYLVLTHPDQDHAGGGPAVLQRLSVGKVMYSGENPSEKGYVQALEMARQKGIPLRSPVAGEQVDLGGGVLLDVLNPPAQRFEGTRSDDNSNCIVLRLRYRRTAMLLTCDLEAVAEERLVADGIPLRADVLKAAHHGSGHSSTPEFLAAVQPRWAIISVGRRNPYGHPHRDTLKRLKNAGAEVFRTDQQGAITVKTDGLQIRVSGETEDSWGGAYRPVGILGRRWFSAW